MTLAFRKWFLSRQKWVKRTVRCHTRPPVRRDRLPRRDLAENSGMAKKKHKRNPKAVLRLPDLEQSKCSVLNSLRSPSSRRSYENAIREFIE